MNAIVSRIRTSSTAIIIAARLSRHPRLYACSKSGFIQLLRLYYWLRTGHLLTAEQIFYPKRPSDLRINKSNGLEAAEGGEAVPAFQAEHEENHDFAGETTDLKVLAYYLPQFHATPENDAWWGEGFTEWTNTRKARPLFPGHYQPREPHDDIGYYDLSDIGVLKRQAEMARSHGIHGFTFYHYWFHGKRLLGKPVDLLLQNPDIDIAFCLCWANETWSKRWDGKDHEILIQQTFSEDDDIEFIKFLAPYFRDPRYVRVDGKPLLQVYRVAKLPSPKKTSERWRKWCRENGIGEIHLVAIAHSETPVESRALKQLGFDGYAAFVPHRFPCPLIPSEEGIFSGGHRFDYGGGVDRYCATKAPVPMYECVTLGWDNTARFGNRANIYIHFSLKQYYEWLKESIKRTREQFPPAHRLLFVNAWNEWAEGTYLEPDKLYGYAYLNTTSRALYGHPFMGSELESSHQAGAAKYSKDYEWLKQTIRAHGENSLTKVNSFIKDSEEILEFGPAAGYFTKFLKEERSAVVDIVEIDVECAKVAAPYARQCIVADLEKDDWASQLGSYRYNTILFADVLEHLRDPLSVLSKASRFLRPKGRIVISVPNLGHWQIVASLINNDFSYNNVGIMDKTHSHFFTEPTLREMVADAGLKVTNFTQVTMPHLPAGCGTKWNNCKVSWGMKRRLKKRPFADAIQIIAVCCRP